jgi:hypothetical protein
MGTAFDKMKSVVDSTQKRLKERKSGNLVASTETGPVGMTVILPIVEAIEELHNEVAQLTERINNLEMKTSTAWGG